MIVAVGYQVGARGLIEGKPDTDWVLDGPWNRSDLTALSARVLLAGVGLLVAWIGCSGTVEWTNQQAWTAGAIGALVVLLTGASAWLQCGLRNLRDAEREMLAVVQVREAGPQAPSRAPVAAASNGHPDVPFVTAEGMTLYHRPSCLLVRAKALRPVTESETQVRALTPCRMCQP